MPLVRGTRRLPRILEPAQVEALMASLRTQRDRAMVQAMLLGALRRCEVLDLRLGDLQLGEWRVLVAKGKGGHQRIVPVSRTFFATVAAYMNYERPAEAATDRLFVVLKGPRRPGRSSRRRWSRGPTTARPGRRRPATGHPNRSTAGNYHCPQTWL